MKNEIANILREAADKIEAISGKTATVQKVISNDPTPNQIEALVDALWHTLERLKNIQSYKDGTSYVMPTFDAAIEYAEAALAPFRKP